jgi:hypothetical protein
MTEQIGGTNCIAPPVSIPCHLVDERAKKPMRKTSGMPETRMDRSTRAHEIAGCMALKAAFVTALFVTTAGSCLIPATLHAAASGRSSGFEAVGASADPQADSQASASPQGATATLTLKVPTAAVDSGTSFQVPVTLTGGTNVFSFAILFDYDSTTVKLTNISPGDFLNSDGATAPVRYSDSPVGRVAISMAREPGSPGLNGKGTLCVLNFEAKASGASDLKIERAFVVDSSHNMTPVHIAPPRIVVK